MTSQILVILGIAINSIGTFTYLIQTLKGTVQPNKVTFFLWVMPPLVVFLSQVSQGVGVQEFMSLSVVILPLTVLAASFVNKQAYWKIIPFDLACGVLSILGLILWYITKIGNIAIILSICADGFATLPTLVKAYRYPTSESPIPWFLSGLGGLCTVLSITTWNFQTFAFPIYYTIFMSMIGVFSYFKFNQKKALISDS